MITYSIVITAVLFTIIGFTISQCWEAYLDGRALGRSLNAAQRAAKSSESFSAKTDAEIDEAVQMANDDRGATVTSIK